MDRPSSSNEIVTVVLVGKTGNGKSATGNSIMGKRTFISSRSMKSVTKTTELDTSNFIPDQTIDVIDTPGLFDTSLGYQAIGDEIVKCIDLAEKGIHAVLMVLSVKNRFSEQEEAAIYCLQSLFGSKIFDYVIFLFTGGDDLVDGNEDDRDDIQRLDDYISFNSPKSLKKILELCGDRKVLFDNRTKDKSRRSKQVQRLLSLVDKVLVVNGREPYTHRHFGMDGRVQLRGREVGFEIQISFMKERIQTAYGKQLKQITEKMESELGEATQKLRDEMAMEKMALNAQIEVMDKKLKPKKLPGCFGRTHSHRCWCSGRSPIPIPDLPVPVPDCNIL